MMKRLVSTALICAVALLAACQQQKQPEPANEESQNKVLPPLHLGAVHQVYPEQGFALLRIIGPIPAPGTVLITHPADGSNSRVGNIMVTADAPTGNRIIAAEIRAGQLVKGDRVFLYRHLLQPEEKPEEEIPTTPTNILPDTPVPSPGQILPTTPETTTVPEANDTQPTAIEPEYKPAAPASEHKTPDHIFDIPDNIDDWQ